MEESKENYPPVNEARCSNELLEHLEHLHKTNDLFGNVAKSQCFFDSAIAKSNHRVYPRSSSCRYISGEQRHEQQQQNHAHERSPVGGRYPE